MNWRRNGLLFLPKNVFESFLSICWGVTGQLSVKCFPVPVCSMEQALLWEHKSTPDECVSTATCMWTLTPTPVWASFLYNLDSHFHKPFNYLIIQISSKTKNEICEYCRNKAVSQTQMYQTFALYYPHCPHIFLFTSPILAALTLWNLFSATSVRDQLLVCLVSKKAVQCNLSFLPSIIKCIDTFCCSIL